MSSDTQVSDCINASISAQSASSKLGELHEQFDQQIEMTVAQNAQAWQDLKLLILTILGPNDPRAA